MKNIILYLFIICSVIVMVGHVYVVTERHSDEANQMYEEIISENNWSRDGYDTNTVES